MMMTTKVMLLVTLISWMIVIKPDHSRSSYINIQAGFDFFFTIKIGKIKKNLSKLKNLIPTPAIMSLAPLFIYSFTHYPCSTSMLFIYTISLYLYIAPSPHPIIYFDNDHISKFVQGKFFYLIKNSNKQEKNYSQLLTSQELDTFRQRIILLTLYKSKP